MITWLYVSVVVNVLLAGSIGYGVYLLNNAGEQIRQYDDFYQITIDSLEKHLTHMQALLKINVGVGGDDSVREVFQTMRNFYEMLVGMWNDGKQRSSAAKK